MERGKRGLRLLIIGAGGFIGLPLAQHLTSAGHEVIGLARTAPKTLAGLLHHVCADRGDARAVAAAVKSGRIESVVICWLLSMRIKALDLSFPLVLDTQRIRSELGFTEVLDEHTALARTIEHELSD